MVNFIKEKIESLKKTKEEYREKLSDSEKEKERFDLIYNTLGCYNSYGSIFKDSKYIPIYAFLCLTAILIVNPITVTSFLVISAIYAVVFCYFIRFRKKYKKKMNDCKDTLEELGQSGDEDINYYRTLVNKAEYIYLNNLKELNHINDRIELLEKILKENNLESLTEEAELYSEYLQNEYDKYLEEIEPLYSEYVLHNSNYSGKLGISEVYDLEDEEKKKKENTKSKTLVPSSHTPIL